MRYSTLAANWHNDCLRETAKQNMYILIYLLDFVSLFSIVTFRERVRQYLMHNEQYLGLNN